MSISRKLGLLTVWMTIALCLNSASGQTVLYQQFFHNRFDQLPFPMNGWKAHHGAQLLPVHVRDGGIVPAPSADYGQLGYAEYTGKQEPVIFWTDDLGTNSLLLEQLGNISFFQQNDSPDTQARLFLSFHDGNQMRLVVSQSQTGSTNTSSWTESTYTISTNLTDWFIVNAFRPSNRKTPGIFELSGQHPDFSLQGELKAFGFVYIDVSGVIRFDHVLIKEREPIKAVFPFPVIYLKIGLAVLGLLVCIYIITHLTIVIRSISRSAHDANEILHGHATTSHHVYKQTSSEDSGNKRK